MRPILPFAFRRLVLCPLLALPLLAQSVPSPAAPPLADPAAYVAREFGSSFKLDPKVPPMFGDLNGDGTQDLVLVGRSYTPLMAHEQMEFKVEDPYDDYFGTGDTRITSQFTLHFDGSARCILIIFDWRKLPQAKPKSKLVSKFVLINTPFETIAMINLRLKKRGKIQDVQALETVDRDTVHALIFWDGKRWRWRAQGMEGDETPMPPPR
jgi:hypothetical protein